MIQQSSNQESSMTPNGYQTNFKLENSTRVSIPGVVIFTGIFIEVMNNWIVGDNPTLLTRVVALGCAASILAAGITSIAILIFRQNCSRVNTIKVEVRNLIENTSNNGLNLETTDNMGATQFNVTNTTLTVNSRLVSSSIDSNGESKTTRIINDSGSTINPNPSPSGISNREMTGLNQNGGIGSDIPTEITPPLEESNETSASTPKQDNMVTRTWKHFEKGTNCEKIVWFVPFLAFSCVCLIIYPFYVAVDYLMDPALWKRLYSQALGCLAHLKK